MSKLFPKTKALLSIALVLSLLAIMLPTGLGALSVSAADGWDGSVAADFAGGTGGSDDPFQISNGAELAYLAKYVNEGIDTTKNTYFKLTADIDLNNVSWTPIGNQIGSDYRYFQGHFDGAGYTISNLNCSVSNSSTAVGLNSSVGAIYHAGLFGTIGSNGVTVEIKNLHVSGNVSNVNKNSNNTAIKTSSGGLAGQVKDCTATISDCSFTGNATGANRCGGLVGDANFANLTDYSITVNNSWTVDGQVTGGNAGGLVGYVVRGTCTLNDCFSNMNLGTTGDTGGLLGYLNSNPNIKITDCHFVGSGADNPISKNHQTTSASLSYVYYKAGSFTNAQATGLVNGALQMSDTAFADGTVTGRLNTDITDTIGSTDADKWVTSTKGYPVLSDLAATVNGAVRTEGTTVRTEGTPALRFHFMMDTAAQAPTNGTLKEYGILLAANSNATDGTLYRGASVKNMQTVKAYDGTTETLVGTSSDGSKTYDHFVVRLDYSTATNFATDCIARGYALYTDALGQEIVVYSNLTAPYSLADGATEALTVVESGSAAATYLQNIVDGVYPVA